MDKNNSQKKLNEGQIVQLLKNSDISNPDKLKFIVSKTPDQSAGKDPCGIN